MEAVQGITQLLPASEVCFVGGLETGILCVMVLKILAEFQHALKAFIARGEEATFVENFLSNQEISDMFICYQTNMQKKDLESVYIEILYILYNCFNVIHALCCE